MDFLTLLHARREGRVGELYCSVTSISRSPSSLSLVFLRLLSLLGFLFCFLSLFATFPIEKDNNILSLYLHTFTAPSINQPPTMATATQAPPTPAHELVYQQDALPLLRSNYGPHLPASSATWMKETHISTPMAEMRRRFATDGYLFLKSVLPREDVLDVRQTYFSHLAPTGILKPGTSPRDGIFNDAEDPIKHNGVGGSDLPEDKERVRKLEEAHYLPLYLKFLEHEKLRGFVREFMGWEKDVLLTRTMLR